MKRTTCISCLVLSLIASGPAMLAQDAAAPFRRASPSPAEATPTPEEAETREEEQEQQDESARRAEPAATPTPASERPTPEQPSAPAPAATPAPDTQKEAPSAKPARRTLDLEPVRPIEPRAAGSRRPRPPEPEGEDRPDDPPAAARGSKPREREAKPARDASAAQPQPRTAAGRSTALDYWDEDSGSAVKNLERKWQKALVDKDVDTINGLLARDFVATSSTGKVGSKATVLSAIRRDRNDYKSADARGMSVRMLGPRVAVVTGTATESGTTPDGKSFRNSRRFTDTWMLRNGKWVCVASQATEVPKG
jgi:ketosteroid isomerase-like protein